MSRDKGREDMIDCIKVWLIELFSRELECVPDLLKVKDLSVHLHHYEEKEDD